MSRNYFNGVKNLSFNGNLFSFELEDKYQNSRGEIKTEQTVCLVSELENVEKILQFLINEINEIKKLQLEKDKTKSKSNKIEDPNNSKKETLGRKLQVVGFEHE